MNLGTWQIDDLITFPCNTHTAATGAATDADSVPSYRVYEDETGTAILTGSMAKLDDASTTGFYSEQITLSAANGFEVGKSYTIYISATVATIAGTMSHTFQVEAAPATAAAVAALNNLSSAQAQTAAAAALTAYDPPTQAEMTAALAAADDAVLAAIAALPAGATAAEVWSYASRTLTQSAAAVTAAVSGSTITATRGDTVTAAITGLGAITGYTALWFTVKAAPTTEADSASKIQITQAGGLIYLNGAAATAGQGSITVNSAATGAITIVIAAAASAALAAPSAWVYDVQWKDATGLIHTLTRGTFLVTDDVTRSTS